MATPSTATRTSTSTWASAEAASRDRPEAQGLGHLCVERAEFRHAVQTAQRAVDQPAKLAVAARHRKRQCRVGEDPIKYGQLRSARDARERFDQHPPVAIGAHHRADAGYEDRDRKVGDGAALDRRCIGAAVDVDAALAQHVETVGGGHRHPFQLQPGQLQRGLHGLGDALAQRHRKAGLRRAGGGIDEGARIDAVVDRAIGIDRSLALKLSPGNMACVRRAT